MSLTTRPGQGGEAHPDNLTAKLSVKGEREHSFVRAGGGTFEPPFWDPLPRRACALQLITLQLSPVSQEPSLVS